MVRKLGGKPSNFNFFILNIFAKKEGKAKMNRIYRDDR